MLKPRIRPSIHVTMRQLMVFESVARLGSLARAAEEMFLSQSTVSSRMRQIADAVGEPLFEQQGRMVKLTPLGEELHAACREIFETWRKFERATMQLKALESGQVRAACASSAGAFMTSMVESFRALHARIDVRLEVAHRDVLLERMARGDDDLYVMSEPPRHFDISAQPFLENPLVAVAPPGHELASAGTVTPARLAQERLLLPPRGAGTRLAIDRFFRERGVSLAEPVEMAIGAPLVPVLLAHSAIAIVAHVAVYGALQDAAVTILDVAGFPIEASWYLVSISERPLTTAARAFAAFALDPEGLWRQRG